MYIYACRKLSGAGGSTTTKPSRRIGGGVGVVVIQTKTVVSLYEASAIVFVIISARICTGGAPLVDLGDGRKYYGSLRAELKASLVSESLFTYGFRSWSRHVGAGTYRHGIQSRMQSERK